MAGTGELRGWHSSAMFCISRHWMGSINAMGGRKDDASLLFTSSILKARAITHPSHEQKVEEMYSCSIVFVLLLLGITEPILFNHFQDWIRLRCTFRDWIPQLLVPLF